MGSEDKQEIEPMPPEVLIPLPAKRRRPLIGRRRLIELSFVVLGVFIALGLENFVQEIKYRDDARELEIALIDELNVAAFLATERQAIAPCLAKRLSELEQLVLAPRTNLDPDQFAQPGVMRYALPQIYQVPGRLWRSSSFDRAINTEAFKRIPSDRAQLYIRAFSAVALMRNSNEAEYMAVARIAPLAYTRTEWTAETRDELLAQLATLDRHQAFMALAGGQLVDDIFDLPGSIDRIRQVPAEEKAAREALISRISKQYGECVDLTFYSKILSPTPPK